MGGGSKRAGFEFLGWILGVDDGPGGFVDSSWSYTCRFLLRGQDSCRCMNFSFFIFSSIAIVVCKRRGIVVREEGYVSIYVGRGFRG